MPQEHVKREVLGDYVTARHFVEATLLSFSQLYMCVCIYSGEGERIDQSLLSLQTAQWWREELRMRREWQKVLGSSCSTDRAQCRLLWWHCSAQGDRLWKRRRIWRRWQLKGIKDADEDTENGRLRRDKAEQSWCGAGLLRCYCLVCVCTCTREWVHVQCDALCLTPCVRLSLIRVHVRVFCVSRYSRGVKPPADEVKTTASRAPDVSSPPPPSPMSQ